MTIVGFVGLSMALSGFLRYLCNECKVGLLSEVCAVWFHSEAKRGISRVRGYCNDGVPPELLWGIGD